VSRYIGRRFVPQSTIERRVQAKDERYARELKRRMATATIAPVEPEMTEDELRQADDDARDEQCGSTCSGGCGWCGRCS
jgi:hypothetical protein